MTGKKERDRARALERRGRVEDAARAYLAAGSLSDAVRVFAESRRHRDAANLIMKAIQCEPVDVGELRGEKRRLAHRAALHYAADHRWDEAILILDELGDQEASAKLRRRRAGKDRTPVSEPPPRLSDPGSPPPPSNPRGSTPPVSSRRLTSDTKLKRPRSSVPALNRRTAQDLAARLEARGDFHLAMTAYERLGAHVDVARLAEKAGRLEEAAAAWAKSGDHRASARCYAESGEPEKALDQLLNISPDADGYRDAAERAIRTATKLSRLDLEIDSYVMPFVTSGVQTFDELEAFYMLGHLYESTGHDARAKTVFEAVVAYQAGYRDAAERVAALGARVVRAGVKAENGVADTPPPREVRERWESHDRLPERVSTRERLASRPVRKSSHPPPVTDEMSVGDVIGGRYRVKQKVGEGGMAEVYEVLDLELETIIALKLFNATANSGLLLERCRRELMLARELTHENIVRVYDIGLHDERRFITMEMLDGTDLREVMDEAPLTWGQSLGYLIQACGGLHAAHLKGVVHRDVKPENFFVTKTDQVKVMDFGIAKKATDTDEITVDGKTSGTPIYMSPEQIRDYGAVTPVSDVYSMGVVAFELLTGEVPFDSDDAYELLMMHLTEPVPAPTLLEPEMPEALEKVILDALAKSPEDRIKTCRAMADRLTEILESITS